MTSILDEMVPKMRRAIGDNEEPLSYQDSALVEYIEDAIDKVSIDYVHGYVVDRQNHTAEPDITPAEQILFVMQSKLDLMNRKPNISFNVGDLSVRRKSDDIKLLSKKIENSINNLKTYKGLGKSITEFDDYAERLRNWLYVETI